MVEYSWEVSPAIQIKQEIKLERQISLQIISVQSQIDFKASSYKIIAQVHAFFNTSQFK